MLANRADAVDEVRSAAVTQIVAIDTRDDDITQAECGDRPREVDRLVGIERQRPPMADIAERTAPRADVAHDHERGRALAEAFADVRARCFLAHRVKPVLAEDPLD